MQDNKILLFDTCALLYYLFEPDKITSAAYLSINAAEKIAVSSISVWEVGIKINRGKLRLPIAYNEFCRRLKIAQDLVVINPDIEIWQKSINLEWPHRDPADRVIVATALSGSLRLATSDREIREYYSACVW